MSEDDADETNTVEDRPPKTPSTGSRGTKGLIAKEWLGLKELTYYADISERTLRSWIYSPVDPLPAVKVCGKVLVRKSEFDAYLERYRIKAFEEFNIDHIIRDTLEGVPNGR